MSLEVDMLEVDITGTFSTIHAIPAIHMGYWEYRGLMMNVDPFYHGKLNDHLRT